MIPQSEMAKLTINMLATSYVRETYDKATQTGSLRFINLSNATDADDQKDLCSVPRMMPRTGSPTFFTISNDNHVRYGKKVAEPDLYIEGISQWMDALCAAAVINATRKRFV